MNRFIYVILLCCFCLFSLSGKAQSDRDFIRSGNRAYHAHKWTEAETFYRKALAKNSQNSQAMYNLGCALMMQQKDSIAVLRFNDAGKMEPTKFRKAKSYHNFGVIMQNHQQYSQAIDAYKMALRNNPSDNETRYNLALCQKLLKNNPDKNKNQNKKDKNKKKNKNKDKQKDKNKQNKQNKQDQNKDKQNKQNDKEKLSKENAEQLLNAAIQQEQATKRRIKQDMSQPSRRQLDQNW